MSFQHLPDARTQLTEMKRHLVAAIADEQRLYQLYSEASREADRWKRRAELAVSKGSDDLARAALVRSCRYETRASEFRRQYLEQKGFVEQMKLRLSDLESRARERLRTIPTVRETERLERTLAHLQRWEDRAREERARLAAWAELERDELAEKLAALEREELLERQLAELKRKLGRG